MKFKDFYKRYKVPLWVSLGVIGVFFLWWLISLCLNTTLFPGPEVVLPKFISLLGEIKTYEAIGMTLLRLAASIAISFVLGTLLGVIAGLNEPFRLFIKPFISVFKTIPTAAVIFVIIALIKPVYGPIIIVTLMTFPIIYEATVSGITSIDHNLIDAMKVDNTSTFKSIFKVYLPLSWNYMLLGMVQSIGLGMKVAIMSEILSGSTSANGIGMLIRDANTYAYMDQILAYSLMAIIIIGIVDIAIYFIKKKLKKMTGEKSN